MFRIHVYMPRWEWDCLEAGLFESLSLSNTIYKNFTLEIWEWSSHRGAIIFETITLFCWMIHCYIWRRLLVCLTSFHKFVVAKDSVKSFSPTPPSSPRTDSSVQPQITFAWTTVYYTITTLQHEGILLHSFTPQISRGRLPIRTSQRTSTFTWRADDTSVVSFEAKARTTLCN